MAPLKKEIIRLLEKRDYESLARLSSTNKKITSILTSLTYDKKKPLSWRAIEAIGLITKQIADSDPDTVRNIVGRLLWMIRDESGGIGWSSPEILGEIVRNNPGLCADVAPIIASFHEEKMLTAGVLRAMGRIGKINDETTGYAIPIISSYINSPEHTLRGYAAYALGETGTITTASTLEHLKDDENRIDFYEDGELKTRTIGEIVTKALEKLGKTEAI